MISSYYFEEVNKILPYEFQTNYSVKHRWNIQLSRQSVLWGRNYSGAVVPAPLEAGEKVHAEPNYDMTVRSQGLPKGDNMAAIRKDNFLLIIASLGRKFAHLNIIQSPNWRSPRQLSYLGTPLVSNSPNYQTYNSSDILLRLHNRITVPWKSVLV